MSASQQEVDRALTVLVASGGNISKACEQLRDVAESTLRDWRTRHADRLQELHDKYAPQIEAQLVRQARDIALSAHQATMLAVEKTVEQLEAGEHRDPSTAARNLEVVAATAIDKTLILTGRPQVITEHREPSKLIASLAAKGIMVSATPQLAKGQPEPEPDA